MSVGCTGSSCHNPTQRLMNLPETALHKLSGVSLAQAQRVQALLQLGVTEQDVQIAERLMSTTPPGDADKVSAHVPNLAFINAK